VLDWQPTQLGLIEDLEQGHYFQQPNPKQQHTALTA